MDHHKTQIKNLPENQHKIQRNYHNSERFVHIICTGGEDVSDEKRKREIATSKKRVEKFTDFEVGRLRLMFVVQLRKNREYFSNY